MSIISNVMEQVNKSDKKQLKGKLRTGTVALLIALLAAASATYAWYVYNTSRHTTKVRMAAGAGVNLQISNSYDGTYGSAAILFRTAESGFYQQDQRRFPESTWLYQWNREPVQSGGKSVWKGCIYRLLQDKPFS